MPNSSRSYCLVLQPNVPAELLLLLEAYIHEHRGLKWLFCHDPSHDSGFVSAALAKGDNSKPWEIQIPSHYVLAIADMSQDRPSIGFVASSQ